MKKIIFIMIFMFFKIMLFSQDLKQWNLELDIIVKDHKANPEIILLCKNKTNKNIYIPKILLEEEVMFYNYFNFVPDDNVFSQKIPLYKGIQQNIDLGLLNKKIKIRPGKTITVKYSFSNFYELNNEIYSTQKIKYSGPLGSTDYRYIYLETNPNPYDFHIQLELSNEDNYLEAKLIYKYQGYDEKYFSDSFFTNNENLGNEYFIGRINDEELKYNYIIGDSFNQKLPINLLRLVKPGDIIITEIMLNNFYIIPDDIISYDIQYSGELGKSNIIKYIK